jgi:hypothetical protein
MCAPWLQIWCHAASMADSGTRRSAADLSSGDGGARDRSTAVGSGHHMLTTTGGAYRASRASFIWLAPSTGGCGTGGGHQVRFHPERPWTTMFSHSSDTAAYHRPCSPRLGDPLPFLNMQLPSPTLQQLPWRTSPRGIVHRKPATCKLWWATPSEAGGC